MLPALNCGVPLLSGGRCEGDRRMDARACATQLTAVKCGCGVCHQGRRFVVTDRVVSDCGRLGLEPFSTIPANALDEHGLGAEMLRANRSLSQQEGDASASSCSSGHPPAGSREPGRNQAISAERCDLCDRSLRWGGGSLERAQLLETWCGGTRLAATG
jgi:hypothetical protein